MQPSVVKFNSSQEYFFDEGCFITELSNSSEDPGLSIARVRVEPGVTTKLHRLTKTIERYVIVEGEGIIVLGEEAPKKVSANDVVIIPADCSQQITNTGDGDLIFLALCSPRFTIDCYKDLTGLA